MNNTIEIIDKRKCSGCEACRNTCPKNAISMRFNQEGFGYPVVNTAECVNCGLCVKVCPVEHPYKENAVNPLVYAVKSDEKTMRDSTSAGVFAVLAEYVLELDGYVCGAAYNESFEVVHRVIHTEDNLIELKKSKYVQSQVGLVYREIKELLEKDKYVLFSGTPCQVAGLQNFLGKRYLRLFTMDVLCHGVPAPGVWKRYLDENIDTKNLQSIDFRHKGRHGFKKHFIAFEYKNRKIVIEPSGLNPFYSHFSKNLGLRLSCSYCEGAVTPRVGDFSAGDFWGAEKLHPDWIDSDSGISVLFINNEHAKLLLPYLKARFSFMQQLTVEEAMTSNRSHISRKMAVNRKQFFEDLQKYKFTEAVDRNLGKKVDIAIYGATQGTNYGGLITYYALYKYLQNAGYSVIMIRPPKGKSPVKNHATRFNDDYVLMSPEKEKEKFSEYNKIADTFILGSDQVWNFTLFPGRGMSFYLDFVNDNKKKIAYASSFGFDKPTILDSEYKSLFPKTVELMKRFSSISVREKDGVDICRNYYNVDAVHVMDPVFLLNAGDYEELSRKAKRKQGGDFMTVYCLTPKDSLNKAFQFVSEKTGLPRVNMGSGNPKKWEKKKKNADMPYMENVQMEEWLYNILNSKIVVTDSYHCVCFSIIFKKNFILVQEAWAPSRIKSLLEKLGLTDRWFTSYEDLLAHQEVVMQDIDYKRVYTILDKEIEVSKKWLLDSINS